MRHRKKLKKLGLKKSHRDALLKNLTASLVLHGKICTTENRAKSLAARFGRLMRIVHKKEKREVIRALPNYCSIPAASRKIIQELKEKYAGRNSGFTRLTKVGMRRGDNTQLVRIELI